MQYILNEKEYTNLQEKISMLEQANKVLKAQSEKSYEEFVENFKKTNEYYRDQYFKLYQENLDREHRCDRIIDRINEYNQKSFFFKLTHSLYSFVFKKEEQ